MKALKISLVLSVLTIMMSCNNNSSSTEGTSPGTDTSSTINPTTNASDYHPDQRQQIPTTDSSNTIGTDTINGAGSTSNTGTNRSYNTQKGKKDSIH